MITDIQINDYNYDLPDNRIARHPLSQRDSSQLLVYRSGDISHTQFSSLPEILPEGGLVVFNNTKVIQARLHFHKETGALIEIFCLEPYNPKDYERIFSQRQQCEWICLIGNRKKWKEGILRMHLEGELGEIELSAEHIGSQQNNDIIRFSWNNPQYSFSEVLTLLGELPIPPYLNRPTEERDKQDYQTVYSKIKGSVAAPTAGLHFTPEVLKQLTNKGMELSYLTLHVGAGTFKPVKSEFIADHEMHSEYIYVPLACINQLIRHQAECTAVGTTSVRTLESLYYIGLKIISNPNISEDKLIVEQWEPYTTNSQLTSTTPLQALEAIHDYMVFHQLEAIHTSTRIIIIPGYTYHFVKRIITNFHQPKSTLLLLVSAFIGEDWHKVYDYALKNNFRFLSYGDSSVLIP